MNEPQVPIAIYEERLAVLLAALRSGNYKQGKQRLRYGYNYCCLGVACDLSAIGAWTSSYSYDIENDYGSYFYLPAAVQSYYGFVSDVGSWGDDDGYSTLSGRNDSGDSFPVIADLIEAHKAELFSWAGAAA